MTEWSAYRFHEMDPLRFSGGVVVFSPVCGAHYVDLPCSLTWGCPFLIDLADGVRMTWRCGDITAGAPNGGDKCFAESLATGGRPVGNPTCDHVISYGWVYVF